MNRHMADKAIRYIHWIFSILVAIGLNIVLYFLFCTEKHETPQPQKPTSKIVMLPIYSGKSASSNDRYLKTWMHFNDPSLIVRPDIFYGYSSVLLTKKNMPYLDSTLEINKKLNEEFFSTNDLITSSIETEKETTGVFLSRLMPFKYPLPKETPPTPEKYEFPYAVGTYSNEHIPVDFRVTGDIDELLKKYPDAKPLSLELTLPESEGLFPEIKILSSTGVPELDKLAVANLIVSDLPAKMGTEFTGKK